MFRDFQFSLYFFLCNEWDVLMQQNAYDRHFNGRNAARNKWRKKIPFLKGKIHAIMWLNWCEKGMKYSNVIRFQTLNTTPSITLECVRMMFHWDDLFEIRFVFVSFHSVWMRYAVYSLKASNIIYVRWTPNQTYTNEWVDERWYGLHVLQKCYQKRILCALQ